MKYALESKLPRAVSGRLSKADRRHHLLEVALAIIREEGADRLTLGHLATRAGVSKPITYEHFGTRPGLLAQLYQSLDQAQANALREALGRVQQNLEDTAIMLATAYMRCTADTGGELHAVRAALAGSEAMGAVHQELLAGYAQLFASALAPHSQLPPGELDRRCVGLVGAGEALSLLLVAGQCSEQAAAAAFSSLIRGGLQMPSYHPQAT